MTQSKNPHPTPQETNKLNHILELSWPHQQHNRKTSRNNQPQPRRFCPNRNMD